MVRITIDNRVNLVGLSAQDDREIKSFFDHTNPQRVAMEKAGIRGWWDEPIRYTTWRSTTVAKDRECFGEDERGISIPRGGWSKVKAYLSSTGKEFRILDKRTDGDADDGMLIPDHRVDLYSYQAHSVDQLISNHGGVLRAPTGSGKSETGIALSCTLKLPTLIVVWNVSLFEQWEERIEKSTGMTKRDIGIIRGKKCQLRPITIGMQQTISKLTLTAKEKNYFGLVLLDEVQRAAASSVMAAIDPWPARYRVGISAEERRKDRKEFLIYDLFGPVTAEVRREDLIESGHVLDVEIEVVPTDFRADWYGVKDEDDPQDDKNIDISRLIEEMEHNDVRNRLILLHARRLAREDGQVVVLAHRREHCAVIDQALSGTGFRTGLMLGGQQSSQERQVTLQGLRDGSVQAGVGTYQAIGVGIDIPRVGAGVCATPIAANRPLFQQVRGRVCRTFTGKTGARLVYLWDRHVFPRHLRLISQGNARVKVLDGDTWIPAREYLAREKAAYPRHGTKTPRYSDRKAGF